MNRKSRVRDSEKGVALVIVLMVLLVAAIAVPPLLSITFAGNKSAETKENRMLELHAADSGIDAALYKITASAYEEKEQGEASGLEALTFDSGLAYQIETPEFNECDLDVRVGKVWWPENLNPPDYINEDPLSASPSVANGTDRSEEIRIISQLTNHLRTLCSDDFESGDTGGGEGWIGDWTLVSNVTNSGDVRVSKKPDETWAGDYHLELTTAGGTAIRIGNITGYENPYLQLKVKATDFMPGDEVDCLVSPDGSNWIIANTWVYGNDTADGYYTPVDIPLADLYDWSTTDTVYLKFDAKFSGQQVAWENFETSIARTCSCFVFCSRTNPIWNGGAGWNANWVHFEDIWTPMMCLWDATAKLVAGGRADGRTVPGGVNDQLVLKRNSLFGTDYPYAYREIDLTGVAHPRIEFWARPNNLEDPYLTTGKEDVIRFKIDDGTEEHILRSWIDDDNSDSLEYYEYDLAEYASINPLLQVRFDAQLSYNTIFLIPELNGDYFYVDDIKVVDTRRFYVDNVIIADETRDAFKAEVAYTTTVTGPAFMDRLGIWLPPEVSYDSVIESTDLWAGNPTPDPDSMTPYLGGTALEWLFDSSPVELSDGGSQLPYVRDITLKLDGDPRGIYVWLRAWPTALRGADPNPDLRFKYFSWDTSCDIFRVVSTATHPLSHHSTSVETFAVQGEINREWYQSFGNYVATGNALMIDDNDNNIRETSIDGLDPSESWGDIISIPADADILGAWLYWSAYKQYYDGYTNEWTGEEGADYDDTVEFMHYKRFYKELLNREKASVIIRPTSDYDVSIPFIWPVYFFPWQPTNDHYARVDDVVLDGISSQVWTMSTNWNDDLFGHSFDETHPDWPAGNPEIARVRLYAALSSAGGTAQCAKPLFDVYNGPGDWTTVEGDIWTVNANYGTNNPYVQDVTDFKESWTWDDIKNCHFGISLKDVWFNAVGCSQVYLEVEYWVPGGGAGDISSMQTEYKPVNPDLWNCLPSTNVYLDPMRYVETINDVPVDGTAQLTYGPILSTPEEVVTLSPWRVCNEYLGTVGMDNNDDPLSIGNKTALQPEEVVYFDGQRKYHDVPLGWINGSTTDIFIFEPGYIVVESQPESVYVDGTELGTGNYTWIRYGNETVPASISVTNPGSSGGNVTIDYVAYYSDVLDSELYDLISDRREVLIDDDLGGNVTMSYSVYGSSRELELGNHYSIDRENSIVYLDDGCLCGSLTVEYSVSESLLGPGNYTVDYDTGNVTLLDPLYSLILPIEDEFQVKIDYTGEYWEEVEHSAWGGYGEDLSPVYERNFSGAATQGHSYVCYADVTSLIKEQGCGNGRYDVRGVDATLGSEDALDIMLLWPNWSYSGWSLIVVYDSPSETSHHLYIWDPIHNEDMPLYTKENTGRLFTLEGFNIPEGVFEDELKGIVDGKMTYCVGEGDGGWQTGDFAKFKGRTEPDYLFLIDPTDTSPNDNDIFNSKWLSDGNETMTGMDIDTFEVIDYIDRSDTDAFLEIGNAWDASNLMYVIMSMKTEATAPQPERYNFTIGTLSYQYTIE